LNFAVEEGELWQFLKLNRKTAVRYRENPDGSYEILEPPKLAEGEEEDENISPMSDQVLNTPSTPSKMKKTPAGGVEMPCMNPISSTRVAG